MSTTNSLKELTGKIAALESQVDLLESELGYIDRILTQCGFPEGIKTLKMTVEELLTESPVDITEDDSEFV
jgi:hypothetical protein